MAVSPSGRIGRLVAVQLSVPGLYLPPVFLGRPGTHPPQTIISLPVQTAVERMRPYRDVGDAGSCPAIRDRIVSPTCGWITGADIRPRRSFQCQSRRQCDCLGQRARSVLFVDAQLSVLGLYLPPVFKRPEVISTPNDHFTASPDCGVRYRASGALVMLVGVHGHRCYGSPRGLLFGKRSQSALTLLRPIARGLAFRSGTRIAVVFSMPELTWSSSFNPR